MTANILTMKWGDYYGPHYVNRLYWAVKRNLSRSFRFLCYTDDPTGIVPEVECHPMIDVKYSSEWTDKRWRKLAVFRKDQSDLEGTCLFLDLDTLIVDSIDSLFDYAPGKFCLCNFPGTPLQKLKSKLKKSPLSGNTSVFRFEANTFQFILENFEEKSDIILHQYANEQQYVTDMAKLRIQWWPEPWVVSFTRQCRQPIPVNLILPPVKPKNAKIVTFISFPNMQHVIDGYSKKYFRGARPTPWVSEHWRDEI